MTNIKLTIEYHGLPYSGWQSQKNEKTVQDEIQKAIFKTKLIELLSFLFDQMKYPI